MKPTILFIHGMFLTAKSWEHWVTYFESRGYHCVAPSWPLHDGEPAVLRAHIPEGTGELALDTLVDHFTRIAAEHDHPVLIGHSLGGLIAQRVVERGFASAAVCISSVAPNKMLSVDWGFLRNSAQIANPLKGDKPFEMTPEGFHKNFGNCMTETASNEAYERYAVHESRNVLRDAMGKAGQIDVDAPHAPLLFIAAEKDEIIPDKLNEKNAKAYSDKTSVSNFKEFSNRGHFICGQDGWEEVAAYSADWIERVAPRRLASAS